MAGWVTWYIEKMEAQSLSLIAMKTMNNSFMSSWGSSESPLMAFRRNIPFFQPIHFPSCFFKRPALRSHSSALMYLAIAHAGTIVIGWWSSQGVYLRKLLGQVALCANAAHIVFEVKGLYNLFITQLCNQWLIILPWFFICNKLSDFCSFCWGRKVSGQLCFKTFYLFGNI